MKLLNLGCGQRYNTTWINVDFVSYDEHVIAHNLLSGIPLDNNSMDVVYHSHVLEHFSKTDGVQFIKECFRVLKNNALIRIAVPNLEMIAKEYLTNLSLALEGNAAAIRNYEWIMLEMYDQTVRNKTGGEMAAYLFQKEIPNEEYVYSRIGEEGRNIRNWYFQQQRNNIADAATVANKSVPVTSLRSLVKKKLVRFLLKNEVDRVEKLKKEIEIGSFRLGGEIHQWMYDRYSLSKLLREVGFENVEVKDAFSSNIPDWTTYHLEADTNGTVFKPDSLFMEAIKP